MTQIYGTFWRKVELYNVWELWVKTDRGDQMIWVAPVGWDLNLLSDG